jgi:hypothetical protein
VAFGTQFEIELQGSHRLTPLKIQKANHAGFWLVKESFGMTMGEATKTISVIQSIVALVGLVMVLLLNLFPPLPS